MPIFFRLVAKRNAIFNIDNCHNFQKKFDAQCSMAQMVFQSLSQVAKPMPEFDSYNVNVNFFSDVLIDL